MKKKKILSICLAGILALGIFAGCGNGASSNGEGNSAKSNSTGKVTEVVFWSIWNPDEEKGGGKLLKDAAEEFNKENPDIKVVIQGQGGYDGVAEKLNTALATKNVPTIAQIEESFIARYYPVCEDLSKILSKETISNYNEGLLRTCYVNDVMNAVPMNRSTPILLLNTDMLKEKGLSEDGPKTWDELKEYAAKLTDEANGIKGFAAYWDTDAWFWESATYSNGGEIVNEDGTKVAFDNEEGIKIVRDFQDMVKDGTMLSPYGAQDNSSDVLKSAFLDGKAAMLLDSIGSLGGVIKETEGKFNVKAVYQPAGTKNSVVTGGANLIVMKDAPEEAKKAAGKFLEYLAKDEFASNFFIETGYFPTTKSSLETEVLKQKFEEIPSYKTAVDQLEYAHPRPNTKSWREMYKVIVEELEVALVDTSKKPEDVINNAAEKCQKILDENK